MSNKAGKGGSFILERALSSSIAVPEELPPEVKELGQVAYEFCEKEVISRVDDFENSETKVQTNIEVLKLAGEQGLLMTEIPEEYGGLGLNLSAATLLAEKSAQYGSFTVSMLCHTGIGTLPILYFGNKDQHDRYLPLLATGEWLAAYALTESNFGSDALGARTRADLSEDGKHYILNGEKIYITNGGFADFFTVYAKVDGKHFSAFLVERTYPGITIGPEEHKMGIKGSSTTSVILEDVKVPVENVLGKIGEGHKSALGVLDIGRFKLGIGVMGNAKRIEGVAAVYANERSQFKSLISKFGMIRRKFADMSAKIFAVESMGYRTAGMIDEAVEALDHSAEDFSSQVGKVFEEFDIECAIMKVMGSETAAFVIDEAVQVHGGAGFIEEYEVARAYRDERINRIFEGTNEINRLLIPGAMLKRSMTGRLHVMPEFMKMNKKLAAGEDLLAGFEDMPLGDLAKAAESARLITLFSFGNTIKKHMAKLQKVEYVMGMGEYFFEKIANMVMHSFAMDSSIARATKLIEMYGEEKAANAVKLAQLVTFEGITKVLSESQELFSSLGDGDAATIAKFRADIDKMTFVPAMDLMAIKDAVAEKVVDLQKYVV